MRHNTTITISIFPYSPIYRPLGSQPVRLTAQTSSLQSAYFYMTPVYFLQFTFVFFNFCILFPFLKKCSCLTQHLLSVAFKDVFIVVFLPFCLLRNAVSFLLSFLLQQLIMPENNNAIHLPRKKRRRDGGHGRKTDKQPS